MSRISAALDRRQIDYTGKRVTCRSSCLYLDDGTGCCEADDGSPRNRHQKATTSIGDSRSIVRRSLTRGPSGALASTLIILVASAFGTILIWTDDPSSADTEEAKTNAYVPHARITIEGDADFESQASSEGWPGDGSELNPYIIGGYDIDGSAYRNGIAIGNTTAHFIVSECYIHNCVAAGVQFWGISNGSLIDSVCTGNSPYAVNLVGSSYSSVRSLSCYGNAYGIRLSSSHRNTLADNDLFDNSNNLYISGSTYNTVVRNNITGTGQGITLDVSSYNTIETNNCSYRVGNGLNLQCSPVLRSSYNLIRENTLVHNSQNGIGGSDFYSGTSNRIDRNNCSYNGANGIDVSDSGNKITNNTCVWNAGCGVYYDNPYNSLVVNNTCSHNGATGIRLYGPYYLAQNGDVKNNTATFNANYGITLGGMSLEHLYGFDVLDNNCSDNSWSGIGLWVSDMCTISGNLAVRNGLHGIVLSGSGTNTLSMNNCSDNLRSGIQLETYLGHEVWYSSNNVITSNTLEGNAMQGLDVQQSSNNLVGSNRLAQNGLRGMLMTSCTSAQVISNDVSENTIGGLLFSSCGSTQVTSNTLSENSQIGIELAGCQYMTLRGNVMTGEGMLLTGSVIQNWGLQDIDSSNLVNGRPVFYLADGVGTVIPECRGQIILANCKFMTIERANFSGGTVGVELGFCNNITITNNTCSDGWYGMYLMSSSNNSVNGNAICGNQRYGVLVVSGSSNSVWNNTLIGNNGASFVYDPLHVQACDNGSANVWNHLSTGNYWSDWLTPDSNYDGIVDVPYALAGSAGSEDLYPLTDRPPDPIPELGPAALVFVIIGLVIAVSLSARSRCR